LQGWGVWKKKGRKEGKHLHTQTNKPFAVGLQ